LNLIKRSFADAQDDIKRQHKETIYVYRVCHGD